jgi:hypothetical protein
MGKKQFKNHIKDILKKVEDELMIENLKKALSKNVTMKYLLHDYVEFWHGQVKRKGIINACFPNSDTYNIVPDGRKYQVTIPEHKIVDRVDMNDFFNYDPDDDMLNQFEDFWHSDVPPIPCEHQWEQASGWIAGKITWECVSCKEKK